MQDYLQSVWSVRQYGSINKYGVDPPVINGYQMHLHRNEFSEQKTLTFKNQNTFVKENHILSRERITCFTTISCEDIQILPEFVFKGVGTRTTVNAPANVSYQWSPSRSYRIQHLKKSIENLPNRYNMFCEKNSAIYVLDDSAFDVRSA